MKSIILIIALAVTGFAILHLSLSCKALSVENAHLSQAAAKDRQRAAEAQAGEREAWELLNVIRTSEAAGFNTKENPEL